MVLVAETGVVGGVVNPPIDAMIPPSPELDVDVVWVLDEAPVVILSVGVGPPNMVTREPEGSRLRIVPLTMTSGPPGISVSDPITTWVGLVLVLVEEREGGWLDTEVGLLLELEYGVTATTVGGPRIEVVWEIMMEPKTALAVTVDKLGVIIWGESLAGG
jgi:hypothetical protein